MNAMSPEESKAWDKLMNTKTGFATEKQSKHAAHAQEPVVMSNRKMKKMAAEHFDPDDYTVETNIEDNPHYDAPY